MSGTAAVDRAGRRKQRGRPDIKPVEQRAEQCAPGVQGTSGLGGMAPGQRSGVPATGAARTGVKCARLRIHLLNPIIVARPTSVMKRDNTAK